MSRGIDCGGTPAAAFSRWCKLPAPMGWSVAISGRWWLPPLFPMWTSHVPLWKFLHAESC